MPVARNLYCFRGSLEGYPDPDNPFINHYLPWAIQSPMLATISLYVSASTLTATQQVDPKSLMVLKGQAIHALNQDLLSGSVSDEAISGVSQFILNEWYFGRTFDMEAHLKGLRQMVLIRGGFDALGVRGLLSKIALVYVSSDLSFPLDGPDASQLRLCHCDVARDFSVPPKRLPRQRERI